jgi:U3 small nucleolar RNA-associated protein 12
MVKAYLRYEPAAAFGVIASAANVVYDADGRFLVTPALESALVWNVKQGSQVRGAGGGRRGLGGAAGCLKPRAAAAGYQPHCRAPARTISLQAKALTPASPASSSSAAPAAAPEVTQLARAPTGGLLAAGYSDGSIRLWDVSSGECGVTLSGHKSAVTALRFGRSGATLASGSNDTDVILWDVAGEAGVVRFRGHKGAVTDVVRARPGARRRAGWGATLLCTGRRRPAAELGRGLQAQSQTRPLRHPAHCPHPPARPPCPAQVVLESAGKIVSSSKDGAVRVWDLTTQHCCQVVGGIKGEVWSLDVNPSETRLVTAASDLELRVYALQPAGGAAAAGAGDGEGGAAARSARAAAHDLLAPMGSVRRQAQERGARVRYDPGGALLGCLVAGKSLELFSVRGEDEARRKAKRRRKRKAEKAAAKAAKSDAGGPGARGGREEEDDDEDDDDGGDGAGGGALRASDELAPMLMVVSKHKVKSFAFAPPGARRKGCVAQVALGLADNSVEVRLWADRGGSAAAAGGGPCGRGPGGSGGRAWPLLVRSCAPRLWLPPWKLSTATQSQPQPRPQPLPRAHPDRGREARRL